LCSSLLHEARPVTAGRRYAFLPFLYDEAAARLRLANNPHLGGEGVGAYQPGDAAPVVAEDGSETAGIRAHGPA
jgi:hypothetical protein